MSQPDLADLACDHCRNKKLRCSRELPKCERCKPWPGPCIYPPRRRKKINDTSNQATPSMTPFEQRRIIPGIQPKINIKQQPHVSPLRPLEAGMINGVASMIEDGSEQRVPSGVLDQAASFVPDNDILGELRQHFGNVNLGGNQVDEAFLEDGHQAYWVPDDNLAEQLVDEVLMYLDMGQGIFPFPSLETIRKVLKHPNEVADHPGLRLSFNCVLAASYTRRFPDSQLSKAFRRNTVIASNSRDLYLNPSVENIMALFLLSAHFPDKLTPTRCWSLMSHAARMAVALNLHKKPSEREILRMGSHWFKCRILVFWGCFTLDQSMALTFGRPPTINPADCEVLDMQLHNFFEFSPHIPSERANRIRSELFFESLSFDVTPSRQYRTNDFLIKFGKVFNYMKTRLDLIMIKISHGQRYPNVSRENRVALEELDEWLHNVKRIQKTATELWDPAITTDRSWNEVHLGCFCMLFQGYHTKCLAAYHTDPKVALSSSLQALSVIEKLHASEQCIFNGVAWQLLYQPFTPFFVVFASTVTTRDASQLDTMKCLPRFLNGMSEFYPEAVQLKAVADKFVNHVSQLVMSSVPQLESHTFPNSYAVPSHVNGVDPPPFLEHGNPLDLDSLDAFLAPWRPPTPAATDDCMEGVDLADKVNPYFDWFSWAFNDKAAGTAR